MYQQHLGERPFMLCAGPTFVYQSSHKLSTHTMFVLTCYHCKDLKKLKFFINIIYQQQIQEQQHEQDITHNDIGYVDRQNGGAWVSDSVHRPKEKLFSTRGEYVVLL
jgi:hypothetical protein